jgi:hypothetical protein
MEMRVVIMFFMLSAGLLILLPISLYGPFHPLSSNVRYNRMSGVCCAVIVLVCGERSFLCVPCPVWLGEGELE